MIQQKLVDEISLNFHELFIIGKYIKISFKKRESPYFFWVLEVKIWKMLQYWTNETFLVSFLKAVLAQKLIYTINIWSNFVFGSFFEQYHLLNSFNSGVYAKRLPKCARISIQKLMQPKIWSMFFFLTLTVRGTFP